MAVSLRNFTSAEDSITNNNNTYTKRESGGVAVYDIQQSGVYGATKMVDTYVPIDVTDNSNVLLMGAANGINSPYAQAADNPDNYANGMTTYLPIIKAEDAAHYSGIRTVTLPSFVPSNATAIEVEVFYNANTRGNYGAAGFVFAPSKRTTVFSSVNQLPFTGDDSTPEILTSQTHKDTVDSLLRSTNPIVNYKIFGGDPQWGSSSTDYETETYKKHTIMLDQGDRELNWAILKQSGSSATEMHLSVRVVGYYVKQAVGSMDGSSYGGISTRIHNLHTRIADQGTFATIASPVPAGEWLINVKWQENDAPTGSALDEDITKTLSKKYTVPDGHWLHFGLTQSAPLYAITTSSSAPAQSEMTDLTTLGLPASEFQSFNSDPLWALHGHAVEIRGVAGGGGGGANVTIGPDAPTGASEGDLWFDDADGSLYVYDGGLAAWVQTNTGGGGGGANVTVGTDAPADATEGDLWYDDGTGSLYVYDGGLAAWVQTNGGGGSSGSNWSTGWVNTDGTTAVANGATLTFNHNLGTEDIIAQVYMATSSDGANAKSAFFDSRDGAGTLFLDSGLQVTGITSSTIEVQLGASGWIYINSSGNREGASWGTTYTHIKVVVSTGGGSSGEVSDNWLTVPALTDTNRFPQARPFNGVQGQNGTLVYNGSINGFDSGSGYSDLYTSMNVGDPGMWHVLRVGPGTGVAESIHFRPIEDDTTGYQGDYNAGYSAQGVFVDDARTSNRGGYIFIPVNASGTVEAFGSHDTSSADYISVEKLATFPYTYSGDLLHNGAVAATAQDNSSTPGAMTTIDASGAVGSRQALMMVRVAPSSGITASFYTRTAGDNLTGYGADTAGGWGVGGCPVYGTGTGPSITSGAYASHGINRGGYVMVLTDTQGRFDAGVSNGTSAVNLTCHSYVIPTIHNTTIFNGSLAGATSNGTYGRFSTINLSNTNTIDTGLTGVKLVYLMCYSASSADVSIAFRPKGDAVTFPKSASEAWTNAGGCGVAVYRVSGGIPTRGGYVACLTNSSGQIEMLSNGAATNVTVVLKASVTPQNLY